MKTVNKNYEITVKDQAYVVIESQGIAINTTNNQQVTIAELKKMLNNQRSEFSADWERTPNTGIQEFLDENEIEMVLIDADSESVFKNTKYRYEFVIAIKEHELYMVRELVGKWELTTGEDIFQPYNDNNGNWTNTSYKTGLTNSLLWYAHEADKLNELLDYLEFENLGTTWIKGNIMVVPNRDGSNYMLKRIEPQQHVKSNTKQSRTRGGAL